MGRLVFKDIALPVTSKRAFLFRTTLFKAQGASKAQGTRHKAQGASKAQGARDKKTSQEKQKERHKS